MQPEKTLFDKILFPLKNSDEYMWGISQSFLREIRDVGSLTAGQHGEKSLLLMDDL